MLGIWQGVNGRKKVENPWSRRQLLFPPTRFLFSRLSYFFKLFLKLRYSDVIAVCRENRGTVEITTLASLTRIYIAW